MQFHKNLCLRDTMFVTPPNLPLVFYHINLYNTICQWHKRVQIKKSFEYEILLLLKKQKHL